MADITISEGDTLEVDYSLENTGDGTGTFDPRLLVQGVQEDQDTGITLDPTQTATGTLQWPTESGDEVTDALAEALTDDTSDSITVTVESGIPDSAVAQFDARSLSGTDGTTINTWPEQLNGYDVVGGSPTIRDSGINGNRALEFDGTDDVLDSEQDWPGFSQPTTIFSVLDLTNTSGRNDWLDTPLGNTDRQLHFWDGAVPNWGIFDGNTVDGSTDTTTQLITTIHDGANSAIREDGSQTGSGDVGAGGLQELRIGANASDNNYWEGYIGEILICDEALSASQIDVQESRLASKWGISL